MDDKEYFEIFILSQNKNDEFEAAYQEQLKLLGVVKQKQEKFYALRDAYEDLIKVGCDKLFKKYPELAEGAPKEDIKLEIIAQSFNGFLNKTDRYVSLTQKMQEFEEFKKANEIDRQAANAFYEYVIAFSALTDKTDADREKFFSKEYRRKMSELADDGIFLYFPSTPDLPLLNDRCTKEKILEFFYHKGGEALKTFLSSYLLMKNVGVSMRRKQEDLEATMLLLLSGYYRTAARNLFALLEGEHRKCAQAFEGIAEKKKEYTNGATRAEKIEGLIEGCESDWVKEAWQKVKVYYKNTLATVPVKGVPHRNSIMHGEYTENEIDVDKYGAMKLMLLWLNLREISDRFCHLDEQYKYWLEYLPYLCEKEDPKINKDK